jgi:sugar lactone lactonase YvrE
MLFVSAGMTIDSEGKLWVASWGGSCVARIDPSTGDVLTEIQLPAKYVTSVAFGGETLSDLYITTARNLIPENEREGKVDGSLFVLENCGFHGVQSSRFHL